MNTRLGRYHQDFSGLWHYKVDGLESENVIVYAVDASNYKPQGPAWFWFNDKPTPIYQNDDGLKLRDRYLRWYDRPLKESLLRMRDNEKYDGVGYDPTYG